MESIDASIDEIPGTDPELAAALIEAALPVDDLALSGRSFFRFRENGRLIGFVGWERVSDNAGLFRSLVVVPAERGNGRGQAMAEWMLGRLSGLGISDAWMLTTTAEKFAAGLGFSAVDRAAVPEAVRRSRQFADLCPSSATLLHKSLG